MSQLFSRDVIFIIILKVLLLSFFSSYYSRELFLPFSIYFVENLENPWTFYMEGGKDILSFPFHSLMLYIFSPFSYIISLLSLENEILRNFIFKIPLLVSDIVMFYFLLKIFPFRRNKVIIFYFLNPVIIYATYMHSQLDIIPTTLLFIGIYYLSVKNLKYSMIFVGLSLATKIHIVIALPLLFFYVYKNFSIKDAIVYIIGAVSIVVFFDMPFLFSESFQVMVLFNDKQSVIFDSFYQIFELKLLLPVSTILMVYFHFFNQKKVNNDLLYFYFGILFSSIIFFIYPTPAWSVWLIPFISIYFIQNSNLSKSLLLYIIFSLVYVIFFFFFYKSTYTDLFIFNTPLEVKIDNEKMTNIVFTFFESILLVIMYAFYKYGIKSNSVYKKDSNMTIGIGGDSGVGKTTLLNNLHNILGNKLLQIEGDGEHKWERGDENWNNFTHLDPKANNIHKQANAILELKHNRPIYRSEYNHTSGKFTKPKKVSPKEFIVIAGLHPFYLPKLRRNIDLKIYIDTNEKLRRHWKILRDTEKRGYSIKKIMTQIESRMDDANKYIYPQKYFSDMMVNYFSVNDFKLGDKKEKIDLGLRITFDANIHMEDILEKLDCSYIWDYNDDLKTQFIELKSIPHIDFHNISRTTIVNVNEIVSSNEIWEKDYNGLIQLIFLKIISEKLKEVEK